MANLTTAIFASRLKARAKTTRGGALATVAPSRDAAPVLMTAEDAISSNLNGPHASTPTGPTRLTTELHGGKATANETCAAPHALGIMVDDGSGRGSGLGERSEGGERTSTEAHGEDDDDFHGLAWIVERIRHARAVAAAEAQRQGKRIFRHSFRQSIDGRDRPAVDPVRQQVMLAAALGLLAGVLMGGAGGYGVAQLTKLT